MTRLHEEMQQGVLRCEIVDYSIQLGMTLNKLTASKDTIQSHYLGCKIHQSLYESAQFDAIDAFISIEKSSTLSAHSSTQTDSEFLIGKGLFDSSLTHQNSSKHKFQIVINVDEHQFNSINSLLVLSKLHSKSLYFFADYWVDGNASVQGQSSHVYELVPTTAIYLTKYVLTFNSLETI